MQELLSALCKEKCPAEEIEPAVFSFIPREQRTHHYDTKVGLYDALIGNPLYNRLVWGNWPANYRAFCLSALRAEGDGPILDVGCGSLVFTHRIYAGVADRPLLLLDRSLGMLLKGKERLMAQHGHIPNNVAFVHADALDLPFKSGTFSTIVSFGLLHIFEQPEALMAELMRARADDGDLFATSLVANNWLGKRYLRALQGAGEVGNVQDTEALLQRLVPHAPQLQANSIGNMAYLSLHA